MNIVNDLFERAVGQPVPGQRLLAVELGGRDADDECLATAACWEMSQPGDLGTLERARGL